MDPPVTPKPAPRPLGHTWGEKSGATLRASNSQTMDLVDEGSKRSQLPSPSRLAGRCLESFMHLGRHCWSFGRSSAAPQLLVGRPAICPLSTFSCTVEN